MLIVFIYSTYLLSKILWLKLINSMAVTRNLLLGARYSTGGHS